MSFNVWWSEANGGVSVMRGAIGCVFVVATLAVLIALPLPLAAQSGGDAGTADAISEKEAFAAAKELGTIEGWNAFLKSFPSGFRSDLARAYVAKLKKGTSGGSKSSPAAGSAKTGQQRIPPLAAGEVMWDPNFPGVRFNVLLGHTRTLATYRYFVSGDVGFPLCMQECAGDERCGFWAFKPGDAAFKTEDTCYLMEAAGRAKRAGDCAECATGRRLGVSEPIHFQPSLPAYGKIELERTPPPLLGERGRKVKAKKKPDKSPETTKTAKVSCVGGWVKNGVCRCSKSKTRTKTGTRSYKCITKKKAVKKKRCPKGQVWSEEGNQCRDAMAEFCGPGYTPVNGKCVNNADLQRKKPAKKKKKAKRRCPKGQVWSAEGNQCRNAAAEFCGPGYTPVGGKCVSNAQVQKKKSPKPNSNNCQQQMNVCLQVCGYVNNAGAKAKCQSGCRKSCN